MSTFAVYSACSLSRRSSPACVGGDSLPHARGSRRSRDLVPHARWERAQNHAHDDGPPVLIIAARCRHHAAVFAARGRAGRCWWCLHRAVQARGAARLIELHRLHVHLDFLRRGRGHCLEKLAATKFMRVRCIAPRADHGPPARIGGVGLHGGPPKPFLSAGPVLEAPGDSCKDRRTRPAPRAARAPGGPIAAVFSRAL